MTSYFSKDGIGSLTPSTSLNRLSKRTYDYNTLMASPTSSRKGKEKVVYGDRCAKSIDRAVSGWKHAHTHSASLSLSLALPSATDSSRVATWAAI